MYGPCINICLFVCVAYMDVGDRVFTLGEID